MERRKALMGIGGTVLTLSAGVPTAVSANQGSNAGKNGKGKDKSADIVVPDDYSTVQEAVDAADAGDTVLVDGGTYVEAVRIEKDLTLRGRNDATIESPSGGTADGIVRAEGDITVDLETLIIDGAGKFNPPDTEDFFGIVYDGANGTVEGNTVKAIREDPLSGYQSGAGIYVDNGADVSIRENDVSDYQKTGIVASGEDTKIDVKKNTVEGQGATDVIAVNGIDVDGASGTVQDNEVSNHGYIGGALAAGILTSPSDKISIQKNTLTDNEAGIGMLGDGNKFQNNEITNGRVTDDFNVAAFILGDNNKAVNNDISKYDYGVFIAKSSENNKAINNTFEDVDKKVVDNGDESKIQTNRQET